MDVGSDAPVGGDGTSTRRRRRARRRTQKGGDADTEVATGIAVDKIVESVPVQTGGAPPKKPILTTAPTSTPMTQTLAPVSKIVIAPPKKKPAKIMLIPKKIHITRPQKTFKAKRVSVTIDNTASTRKQRRMTMARVDAMTEDQLRETAVSTKLSRLETVKKVPVDLLRQMLKDYYTMRKMLL